MINEKNQKFDLEERTSIFAEKVISFAKLIKRSPINNPLTNQIVKSSTSIGANYCEADSAESHNDFIHKIGICKKEAKGTRYWIRIIVKANFELEEKAKPLWQEANELFYIFAAIVKNTKNHQ